MLNEYNNLKETLYTFKKEKEAPITSLHLILTNRCNLQCSYCVETHNNTDMSFTTAKYGIDMIANNAKKNTPEVIFFGGEPLLIYNELVKPLTEYIRNVYGQDFKISIMTNGLLLDEEKLEFLKRHNCNLMISIDGDELTNHSSSVYNKYNYEKLFNFIPTVLSFYPDCYCRSTGILKNAEWFVDNFNVIKDLGFKKYNFRLNVYDKYQEEKIPYLSNFVNYFTDYFIESCKNNIEPMHFKLFEEKFLTINSINIAEELNAFRNFETCYSCNICGLGGTNRATLAPNGKFYTCEFITSLNNCDDFCIGNIQTGIDDNVRNKLYRDYDVKQVHSKECDSCRFNKICTGFCTFSRFFINSEIYQPNLLKCTMHNLLLDGAIKAMNTLYDNSIFNRIWREIYGIN